MRCNRDTRWDVDTVAAQHTHRKQAGHAQNSQLQGQRHTGTAPDMQRTGQGPQPTFLSQFTRVLV